MGRPTIKRRGRPKTSLLTKEEQQRAAVKKYVEANPIVKRKAVKTYTKKIRKFTGSR